MTVDMSKQRFNCDICNRSFARKDVVKRHIRVIHLSIPTAKQSRRRSCERCAASKLKCTGGLQCENCKRKGLQCRPGPAAVKKTAPQALDKNMNSAIFKDADRIKPTMIATSEVNNSNERTNIPGQVPEPVALINNSVPVSDVHSFKTSPSASLTSSIPTSAISSSMSSPIAANCRYLPNDSKVDGFLSNFEHIRTESPGSLGLFHQFDQQDSMNPSMNELPILSPTPDSPENTFDLQSLEPIFNIDWLRDCSLDLLFPVEPRKVDKKIFSIASPPEEPDNWPLSYRASNYTPSTVLPPISEVVAYSEKDSLRNEFTHVLVLPYKSLPWPSIDPAHIESFFPSSKVLEEYVGHYFSRWYPVCPIFHRGSWDTSKTPSILMAAIVSIGASFSDHPEAHQFADNLSELTKRTISWTIDKDRNYLRKEYFLTTMLLQGIYSLGSGNKALYEAADSSRSLLVTNARAIGLFNLKIEDCANWLEYERMKRVAWLIFEFDCTICTLTSSRPCMSLHDLNNNLPCSEDVWDSTRPWEDGPPFQAVVSNILSGQTDSSLNWYSKRLVAQALGRSVWDYGEMESTVIFRTIGTPDSHKARLLTGLDLLQGGADPTQIVHVTMSSMICSYSHLYNNHLLELITSATRYPSPARIQKLEQELDRDAQHTRNLAWHASQIIAVVKHSPIHAPCETMRVFMAGLFLYWFSLSSVASDEGASIVRLDLLSWQNNKPDDWIQNGGMACIGGHDGFIKVSGIEGGMAIIDSVIDVLKSLHAWGLAEKFCRVLCKLRELGREHKPSDNSYMCSNGERERA